MAVGRLPLAATYQAQSHNACQERDDAHGDRYAVSPCTEGKPRCLLTRIRSLSHSAAVSAPTGSEQRSQEALAKITALHRTEVSLLERGRREPRLSTIIKLADALSVPPAQFFAGIDWRSVGSDFGGFEFQELGDAPDE